MPHLHCLLALALVPAAAAAQSAAVTPDAPSGPSIVYEPAWFAAYAPATAFDMVSRIPGFTLREGEARRGFSGTEGNLLIDGVHPNTKNEALADQLKRIPLRQVLRIEVWRRADSAGGLGETLEVNVVRVALTAGGVWSAGAELADTGQPAPNGYAAVSGRWRNLDYSVGGNAYSLRRELDGTREVRDGAGNLTGRVIDTSPRLYGQYAVNAELGSAVAGGKLRGHISAFRSKYADRSVARKFAASGQEAGEDRNPYRESKRTFEAGLDFERKLRGGQLKLAALSTRQRFISVIVSTSLGPDSALWARYSQDLRHDSAEDIVRASYGRDFGSHHVEAGAEAAFNRFDARTLDSLDVGAGPQPLAIPNANIRVEERRGEAYASDTWAFRPRWSLQMRLAAEASRLDFTGDTVSRVRLAYVKPSLQLSRDIGPHQIHLRLARDAGQLDFDDFTSAAAFADGRINGGNPELKPQTTWRVQAGFDGRFGRNTALSLRVYHDRIDDAQDLVPVSQGGLTFDAPGNIGRATVDGIQMTAHLPLDHILPGAQFDLDATLRHSRVRDPVTHENRPLSNLEDVKLTAGLRQDLPRSRFAWGVNYTYASDTRQYDFSEIDRHRDSPSLDAFVEVKIGTAAKLTITAKSLAWSDETRQRVFFAGPRPAAVDHVERRVQKPGCFLYATISGWF